jgi:hypothetical protein
MGEPSITYGSAVLKIAATRCYFGSTVCSSILFAHAVLGCNTPATPHQGCLISENKAVDKLKSNSFFARQAEMCMNSRSNMEDVTKAGNHVLSPCIMLIKMRTLTT